MLTFQTALPAEAGIPESAIKALTDRLDQKKIPMHSLLIWRHEKLVTEWYYAPVKKGDLHRMFSVSKTLTAIGIGLLADEGKLKLSDRIVTFFPEKVPADVHPWVRDMTIRDLLRMRTCHASTTYKIHPESDWVESFFTTPPDHKPGTLFHYDTSAAHVLCALTERLSGQKLTDYVRSRMPELGLSKEAYMICDPFGISMGGSGLMATSEDLLRIGYLLYHKGLVEGKQLLSKAYLEEALSRQSPNIATAFMPCEGCGYGYQLWIGEQDAPILYGMGGQLVFLLPKQDMMVVTTADTQGIAGGVQMIHDAIYDLLLPALDGTATAGDTATVSDAATVGGTSKVPMATALPAPESPVPGNPAAGAPAADFGPLQIKPLQPVHGASLTGPLTGDLHQKTFRLKDNPEGFQDLRFTFTDEKTGTLEYTLSGTPCRLSFGFGALQEGRFPIYDRYYAGSGIWLQENTLYLYLHVIDEYVGSVRMEFVFGKTDDGKWDITAYFRKVEETILKEYNCHLYGIEF